ncbi:MAG: hypothetical protein HC802_17295, partial [Caldilineaceae bacterium]|nr:hypothetical protein [Caldilineaceae bacterium]
WLAQPAQRLTRSTGYRIAEIVLLLVLTRLVIWAVAGSWPTPMTLMTRPFEALMEGFVFGAIVVSLSWIMATAMTNDLIQMALRPDDLYTTRSFANRWQDNARPVHTDRGAILRRFVTRWVVGGLFLVTLAASSQIGPSDNGFLAIARQNIEPTVIIAVIVYFLAGLVLISQGQLAVLRARWTLQKTPNSRTVLRNWSFYAFGLILIVGLLATLMPLGGTFRFAQILGFLIEGVYLLLFGIFRMFFTLFLLLVSLFTGEQPPETPMEARHLPSSYRRRHPRKRPSFPRGLVARPSG